MYNNIKPDQVKQQIKDAMRVESYEKVKISFQRDK